MSCLGVHISLDAQEAGALEAASEADRVALASALEAKYLGGEPLRAAESDKAWDAMHRALSDGELTYDGGTYPLSHVVLGGKALYSGDDFIISYKGPEQVKDIAAALAQLDQHQFEELYWRINPGSYDGDMSEDDFDYTLSWLQGVTELYSQAAQAGLAVVFTADQ